MDGACIKTRFIGLAGQRLDRTVLSTSEMMIIQTVAGTSSSASIGAGDRRKSGARSPASHAQESDDNIDLKDVYCLASRSAPSRSCPRPH